jgi:hypothetical protein
VEHVIIRRLEHLTGGADAPGLGYAVETRERPGPAHKNGAFPDDPVWVQLRGGLFVAKASIQLCWIGEYSSIREVRNRTRGSQVHALDSFWAGRPRYGYAAVASLQDEKWLEPYWAGPRTYGYEWVLLDDDKKRATWREVKSPPRGGDDLEKSFRARLSNA